MGVEPVDASLSRGMRHIELIPGDLRQHQGHSEVQMRSRAWRGASQHVTQQTTYSTPLAGDRAGVQGSCKGAKGMRSGAGD